MSSLVHSIKFKIGATFGICILLMLIIGATALIGIRTLSNNSTAMFKDNLQPIVSVAAVRADVIDIRLQLRRAQTFRNEAETKEAVTRINKIQADLKKNWDAYYPDRITNANEKKIADSINKEIIEFRDIVTRINDKMAAGKYDEATEIMEVQMTPIANAIEKDISLNLDSNIVQSNQVLAHNLNTSQTILWSVLSCIVVAVLFALLASVFIVTTITKPLQHAIAIANQIADGHLENEVTYSTKDEFRHLLGALARMDGQLTKIVKGIKMSSSTIATASGEIAAGNLDLSGRTEAQAGSLEETASAMEQLTATVKQNSESAQEASKLALTASKNAVNGGSVVEEVITTMDSINASSKKIVDIISVIDGIAFQTNILALNAAVEAARAGEQGRGFAVVASEVRNLAQRSASAAKEIKLLIDDSVQRVDSGSKLVADAGITMREVVASVKMVTSIVGEISSASNEQATGIAEINRAIVQMDEVTQQNAALVEQAAAAAQSLSEQATNLEQSVRVFALRSETEHPLILQG